MPSTLRLAPAVILGKATAVASRALRLGGGTTMPGRVARAVAPDITRQLAARLPQGCVVVTGTNGKTTTSRLIHHILQLAGLRPVHNRAGANLAAGIVTALEHAADARYCYRCGVAYEYTVVYFGHMGDYRCPQCGTHRPQPLIAAEHVELAGLQGSGFALRTPAGTAQVRTVLPGVYNIHNVLAAAACCLQLGVPLQTVARGVETFAPAFGRAERVRADGREAVLLLTKNPAGFNEVLRTVMRATGPAAGVVLIAINDLTADGRDISWLWDVDFEMLAGHVRSLVVSGIRADDMALRLKHAGVSSTVMTIDGNLSRHWHAALQAARNGEPVYGLPTYAAMLQW